MTTSFRKRGMRSVIHPKNHTRAGGEGFTESLMASPSGSENQMHARGSMQDARIVMTFPGPRRRNSGTYAHTTTSDNTRDVTTPPLRELTLIRFGGHPKHVDL